MSYDVNKLVKLGALKNMGEKVQLKDAELEAAIKASKKQTASAILQLAFNNNGYSLGETEAATIGLPYLCLSALETGTADSMTYYGIPSDIDTEEPFIVLNDTGENVSELWVNDEVKYTLNAPLTNTKVHLCVMRVRAVTGVDGVQGKIDILNGAVLDDRIDKEIADRAAADTAIKNSIKVEKLSTAQTGYVASYRLTVGGTQNGDIINIPKDYLVKSAEVKTATTADTPVSGLAVGDKYIAFVINTKDSTDTTNESHIYIKVSDLVTPYTAGSGIGIDENNQISLKALTKGGLEFVGDEELAIQYGDGLSIDVHGSLIVDTATDAEVTAMLNEVFGS